MAPLLAMLAASAVPFTVTLNAPTHTPKVNARWNWSIRAVDLSGKPIRALVTANIVDPFGGVHSVEFGNSTKLLVRFPFTGTFRDFVRWPPEARGFRLTFRVTVTRRGRTVRRSYWVRPR